MQLVLATRNANKLEEIRDVLGLDPHRVKSSFDYPQIPDVVEDKDTLEGNAIKKATTIAAATGCWALADDSGLEVDALGGAPGCIRLGMRVNTAPIWITAINSCLKWRENQPPRSV